MDIFVILAFVGLGIALLLGLPGLALAFALGGAYGAATRRADSSSSSSTASSNDSPDGTPGEQTELFRTAGVRPAGTLATPGAARGGLAHAMSHPAAGAAANDARYRRECAPCARVRRFLRL